MIFVNEQGELCITLNDEFCLASVNSIGDYTKGNDVVFFGERIEEYDRPDHWPHFTMKEN